MFRIPRHVSIIITQIFTGVIFVLLVLGVIFLPRIIAKYFAAVHVLPCFIIFYSVIAVAFGVLFVLHLLLNNIRLNMIFIDKNVVYLRLISWGCVLECLIFLVLSYYFLIAYLLSFGCLFLSAVIRVVKNIMEDATAIKDENDYTI
jgi:hypothetical protein